MSAERRSLAVGALYRESQEDFSTTYQVAVKLCLGTRRIVERGDWIFADPGDTWPLPHGTGECRKVHAYGMYLERNSLERVRDIASPLDRREAYLCVIPP